MLYTDLTKKALKIAFKAHEGQVDKAGMPYICHPLHLAGQMEDEAAVCAALLHDVAEDTDITVEQLEEAGFGGEIAGALRLLTHREGEPYMDYIRRIRGNRIARAVKLADLSHNGDLSRLDRVDEGALERAEKYRQAMDILTAPEETGDPRIDRISRMERHMDGGEGAVKALSAALAEYAAARPGLDALEEYLTGGDWLRDYDSDCAGELPPSLKRGVLSQDGLYRLLQEDRRLRSAMAELAENHRKEEG